MPFYQLKVTCSPPNINLFFMKTNFMGSYKTIEEHYTVIFQELSVLECQLFSTELLQNWYVYSIYPQQLLYKFHKDWTSSFGIVQI